VIINPLQQLEDLPPAARACWTPARLEGIDRAALIIISMIARQPLSFGVLLGRTDPVVET